MALSPATDINSGITNTHLPAIHRVCQKENTFLFIRPSEPATMRLIDAGFATKSMDIHDKSSNWNLTAGLVPVDQAFSKKKEGKPNDKIHPHDHGEAKAVHLVFDSKQFSSLWAKQHFLDVTDEKTGTCVKDLKTYRHFHSRQSKDVCFLLERRSGKVFWKWMPHLALDAKPVPMYVWAYNGIPVTGDYDLWMVAPHITNPDWGIIESVTDSHGRSAATKFTTDLMKKLNKECHRTDKPVFNHGAEAQNYSFTQERDQTVAMFCPGSQAPKSVPWEDLPNVLHDLLRNGYVVIRNPKWITGETLAAEDIASARYLFPTHERVTKSMSSVSRLKRSKVFKDPTDLWTDRDTSLQFLRLVAKIPDLDKKKNLVLVDEGYFQSKARWVKLAHTIHKHIGDLARKYSKEVEEGFGRAGFIMTKGHVSPIDMTIDRLEEAKFVSLGEALAKLKSDIAKEAVEKIRAKMKDLKVDMKYFEDCPYESKASELRWILGILWGLRSGGKLSLTHYREYHRFLVYCAEQSDPMLVRTFSWYI